MARKSKLTCWKLQRPLFTNGDYTELLAYTENKEQQAFIHTDTETIRRLFDGRSKVYVMGYVKNGNLKIESITHARVW